MIDQTTNFVPATNVAMAIASWGEGIMAMAYLGKFVVYGALAASVTLGAVQFASGHDLTNGLLARSSADTTAVNRAAKTDRAAMNRDAAPMQTVVIRLSQFEDTSFLLRIPLASSNAARGESGAVPAQKPVRTEEVKQADGKRPIACEPMVSVLTEIAKRLQPGRCVT